MYEELLPYWKRRCRSIADNSWRAVDSLEWMAKIRPFGPFEWVSRADEEMDCLVGGVMLFSHEAGMEP